jgi:hypothetical protein
VPDWDTFARINALQRHVDTLRRDVPAAEREEMTRAQARFDSVGAHTGDRAPPPILGETSLDYRKRLLSKLTAKSERFKHSCLDPLNDRRHRVSRRG